MKLCKVEGCKSRAIGHGYCDKHNTRLRKYGDPLFTKYGKDRETHDKLCDKEYSVWKHMKERCTENSKKNKNYYFDKNIEVCDKWKNSFQAFYKDMGKRPSSEHQIDRIKNDKGYYKGNCRWATSAQNCQNKSNNVLNWFTVRSIRRLHNLKKYTSKELCLIYKLKLSTLESVIYYNNWKEV